MTDEPVGRYSSAVEREKAKLDGVDSHPADSKHRDPMNAVLADKRANPTPKAKLRHIGGSDQDEFNIAIANSVLSASWVTSKEQRDGLIGPLGYALAAIGPTDELEGMLAAQMVAAHQASMECSRRAMIDPQTIEGRAMNLKQAARASSTFAALLETLNKHRSKGQQRVIVEHVHRHVHVHDSSQPIVDHPVGGGGGNSKIGVQPHAPRLAHSAQPLAEVRSEDAKRQPVPRPSDGERKMSDARRPEPRRADGRSKR